MNTSDTNHKDHGPQAELDQHIAALRDAPTEAAPPDATVAATLAMLGTNRITPRVARDDRPRLIERLIHMTFTQRIAAAVMITLGALTLYVMFTLFSGFGASVAFADVVAKFEKARTIQYTSSVTIPGKPAVAIRTLVAEPDRLRTEMPDGTATVIHSGKSILLLPKSKKAILTTYTGIDPAADGKGGSLVDALRTMGGQKGEPIGEKEIDGVPVVGFRSTIVGQEMQLWANKKTADPVRVELKMVMQGMDATMVMDRFIIDAPLDDSLFSFDPPAGYELETNEYAIPDLGKVEDEVVELLRAYADKSEGGEFPTSLNDWAGFSKTLKDKPELIGKIGGITGMLGGREAKDYGYAGRGVKLGEKDKIVFWVRPEHSKTYRAVYGDLRIEDVTADKLPKE